MNKKILIWIIVLILLISLAFAYDLDNATIYYSFDDANLTGSNPINLAGDNYNGSNEGADTGETGILAESFNFVAANTDYIGTTWIGVLSSFTISMWVKNNTACLASITNGFLWASYDGIDYASIYLDNGVLGIHDSRAGGFVGTGSICNSNWHHIVYVYNRTGTCYVYIDGVVNGSDPGVDSAMTISPDAFAIGARNEDGTIKYHFGGYIDEFAHYPFAIDASQVAELYNSGIGYNPYTEVTSDTINISSPSPANNTQFNTATLNHNLTVNSTYDFNCTLNINGTANTTQTGITSGTGVFVNFTNTYAEGTWNYSIFCTQGNDTSQNETTSTNTFYIDITVPTITNNFINKTLYFQDNLSFQVNFSDNLILHSYNISIDGTNIQGNNSIETTNLQVNFTYDTSSLAVGLHTLSLRIADGHTANTLRYPDSWKWKNGLFNDYLKYEWEQPYDDCEVTIKNKNGGILDGWGTIEDFDSFKIIFEPNDLSNSYTFEVETDCGYDIINAPNTKYKKWLVIGEEHWLDFYLDGAENIEIIPITNKEVEVVVSNLNPTQEIFYFNSIGDLNIVTKNYTFYTTNATATYSAIVSELEEQTFTLDILTGAGVNETDVNFIYNNTPQNLTKLTFPAYDSYTVDLSAPSISSSSEVINFTWFYNITGLVDIESGNITANQTALQIMINNCSNSSWARAINITVRRDDNNSLQVTDIGAYFEVWVSDIDAFKSFNLTWTNVSEGGVCIYPNSSDYTSYAQFEFGGAFDGFNTETHYLTNYTLDNDTQLLDFYLTPNGTLVTFTVTDQDDNVVEGVFIHVLRYDFDTNSHITTEILEIDELGQAIGSVVLTTQWYKFILIYEGDVVLETNPVKITSTTRNFRINLQTNFFDFFETFDSVQTSLTFTNATLNYAYTFVNTLGTSVTACLKVIYRSAINDVLINESCVTSTSGTILVNVGNSTSVAGKSFIGVGRLEINPVKITDIWEVSFIEGYKKWGKDGIFISFLVRLTLVMVGLWNPMVAIILLMLADIGMISMGLYYMSWTILIFYIILGGLAIYKMNRT